MIIVKNRELLIPRNEQYIGTPNDNNADNRVFRISRLSQTGEDLSGLTYRLDLLYPDKRNVYTVSAVTSRSGRSVVVLTTLFARQYPAAGTYTFSFDGTNWKHNNQNVTLSEVGIVIAYNPVSGDTVTVTSTIQQVITDTVLLSKEITDEYINLTWTVTAAQLAIPGTVYVTLRGANDDAEVRWASFQGAFYVEQNNYTPAMFTGPMSELEYFEQVLSSNLEKLEYLPTKYEELEDAVEDAEAWAKGTRSGSEVQEGDDTYHNNSKYYSELANASKNAAEASQSAAAASQNAAAASASQAAQIVPDLINSINTETNRAKAAENTLQQNISTEAQARAATDSSLQSQINQYVNPSTQQPDEVVNARVGADGTTYSTLGDAVRGQVTDLKSTSDSAVQGEKKTYQYGYIDCARATIPITDVTSSLYYKYLVDPCSEGDIYVINGTGSSGAKPWAFVDSTGKRLSFYQSVGGGWTCDSQVIVAPANSAYLISNYHINSTSHPLAYKFGADVHGESLRMYSENAVSIPSNSDLNSYITAGNYKVVNVTTAGTISNIPEAVGGRLSVIALSDADALHQWYISDNNNWYYRQRISGNWSAWKTVAWQGSVDIKIAALGKPIPTETNGLSQIPSSSDLNDYRTAGTYIVFTASVAKTISNIPENYSGRLIVMATSATAIVLQIFITNTNHIYSRIYSSGWTNWSRVADFDTTESNKSASKGAYNALQSIIKNSQYDIAFANAFSPLTMKNYLGNSQNVHPKVLYFENGFGGHLYWMAYTPYPYSQDGYENPCIAYSDDGYAWTNINGNPLDDPNGVGYNSDTHLVYDSANATLECWYRYVGDASQSPREETIYRQTTTDGVTWSAKEVVYSNTSGQYAKLLSPAIIIENNKYCIWVVNGDGGSVIDYYEAPVSNVTSWTKIRTINFSITDNGVSVKPWHIDVIMDNGTYAILLMCRNGLQISNNYCSLFIATSTDNITYLTPLKVVAGADNWDKYMYRSSIVKVGNKYRIYYSASGGGTTTIYNNAVWGIGISNSDSLTSGYIGEYI